MKRKDLLLFIFCFVVKMASSQIMEIGPIAFTGISSTRIVGFSFQESGLCYGGGMSLRFKLTEKFYFGTDFLYDRKGYRHKVMLTDPQGTATGYYYPYSHRAYVSVPLFLNMRFGNGKTKFIFNAGTYVNYLIRETYRLPIYTPDGKMPLVTVENDKKVDSGILIGLGFSTQISSRASFHVELRNCFGLIDVAKGTDKDPLWLNSHYLFIGFNFKLGKKSAAGS